MRFFKHDKLSDFYLTPKEPTNEPKNIAKALENTLGNSVSAKLKRFLGMNPKSAKPGREM